MENTWFSRLERTTIAAFVISSSCFYKFGLDGLLTIFDKRIDLGF
jgi:hypothetical protein